VSNRQAGWRQRRRENFEIAEGGKEIEQRQCTSFDVADALRQGAPEKHQMSLPSNIDMK
jgi:hypothetical protein